MMPASLFIAQSFSGLESTDELKLRNIYEHLKKYKNNFNEDIENFTNHDLIKNAAENIGFSLDYCATSLSRMHEDMLPYMNHAKKIAQMRLLLLILAKYLAKYKFDKRAARKQDLEDYACKITKCTRLIDALLGKRPSERTDFTINDNDKIPSYTRKVISAMSEFNGQRLQAVWWRSVLGGLLASERSSNWSQKDSAKAVLGELAFVAGQVSWSLYAARFAINFGLIIKHFRAWSIATKNEKEALWKILSAQLDKRKFSLLNDFFWGIANGLTFFVLVGDSVVATLMIGQRAVKISLDLLGSLLTVVLLLMDTVLTVWRLYEANSAHKQELEHIEAELKSLDEKIKTAASQYLKKDALTAEREYLVSAKSQCELEWKYKQYVIINDLVYAILLSASFSVMAVLSVSISSVALPGAIACFILNTATTVVTGLIEVCKAGAYMEAAKTRANAELACTDEKAVNFAYLQWAQSSAEFKYYDELRSFYITKTTLSLITALLVPALVITALLCTTWGLGLVLGVSAVIITAAQIYLQYIDAYKPLMSDSAEMLKTYKVNDFNKHRKVLMSTEATQTADDAITENDIWTSTAAA